MNVFVTGGLGFVGRRLSEALLEAGHTVTASGRTRNPETIVHPRLDYVADDTTQEGPWQDRARKADAAVNLAGVSIFGLWTKGRKQELVDSRILTTRNLAKSLSEGGAGVLCSASAVGCYGSREDHRPLPRAPAWGGDPRSPAPPRGAPSPRGSDDARPRPRLRREPT